MGKGWFRAAILADEVLEKVAPVPSIAECFNEKEKKKAHSYKGNTRFHV